MFRLGLLEWRRGRIGPARHRLRTVLALLEPVPDDVVVDADHQITASSVRTVARALVA
jgi:hypothetical protein